MLIDIETCESHENLRDKLFLFWQKHLQKFTYCAIRWICYKIKHINGLFSRW